MTVWLHYFWPDKHNVFDCIPCNGTLDSLSKTLKHPFAFTTATSALGNLTDTVSIYGSGYNNFKLKMLADVYIVLNPCCENEHNKFYFDVANDSNITQINKQVHFFYDWEKRSAQQINDSLRLSAGMAIKDFEILKNRRCH